MARYTTAITITGDASDAVRALRKTANEAQKTNRELKGLSSSTGILGLVTKLAASRMALMGAGIAAAIPFAIQLASSLAPLLGLLVAVPGAAIAAGAAFAAFKIATAGVGDVLKQAFAGNDVTGGGKAVVDAGKVASARTRLLAAQVALNKAQTSGKSSADQLSLAQQRVSLASTALSKAQHGTIAPLTAQQKAFRQLPPSAQQFVRAILSVQPALRALRATVANAFFSQFAGQIKGLAQQWIPALQTGFKNIAASLGRFVSGFVTVLRSPAVLKSVSSVMKGVGQAIDLARPGLTALFKSLLLMGPLVTPVLRRLGKFVSDLSGSFAKWLDTNRKSGRMNLWLGNALKAVRQIWIFAGNLLKIFGSIFKASGSNNFLAVLDHLSTKLANFLGSSKGQSDLKRFFSGANGVAGQLWDTVKILAPVVLSIAKAIGPIAITIASITRNIAEKMLPVVKRIADYVAAHKKAAEAIAILYVTIWTVSKIVTFVAWLGKVRDAWVLIRNAAGLAAVAEDAASGTGGAAAGKAAGLGFKSGLLAGLSGLAVRFGPTAAIVLGITYSIQAHSDAKKGKGPFDLVKEFLADPTLKNLLRSSAFFSPLYWVVNAFTRFGGDMVKGMEAGFAAAFGPFLRLIGKLFVALIVVTRLAFGISSPSKVFYAIGVNLISGLLNGIRDRWNQAQQYVLSIPDRIKNWFRQQLGIHSPSSVMYGYGRNIVAGLAGGISSSSGVLTSAMAGLNTTLTGGFGAQVSASSQPLHVTIHLAPGTSTVDAENQIVGILDRYQRRTGRQIMQVAR